MPIAECREVKLSDTDSNICLVQVLFICKHQPHRANSCQVTVVTAHTMTQFQVRINSYLGKQLICNTKKRLIQPLILGNVFAHDAERRPALYLLDQRFLTCWMLFWRVLADTKLRWEHAGISMALGLSPAKEWKGWAVCFPMMPATLSPCWLTAPSLYYWGKGERGKKEYQQYSNLY